MPRDRLRHAACLSLALSLLLACPATGAAEATYPLLLAVTLNHEPTDLIGNFSATPEGKIGATAAELLELGIAPDASADPGQLVWLDEVPGLSFSYDEPGQAIDILVAPAMLKQQSFSLRPALDAPVPQSALGAVLNYDLRGNFGLAAGDAGGVSVALEGRVFSPLGLLEQSAFAAGDGRLLRLDTSYEMRDPGNLLVYRFGDYASDGLGWTRPLRLGGFEVRRSYELRPDLVTAPQMALEGTAAVPSTLDVYLGNSKAFSTGTGAGPFEIGGIVAPPEGGDVTLVVTDPLGNQTRRTVAFHAAPGLLAPGLTQWSAGIGLPRFDYGLSDDRYGSASVALGSLRLGLSDWLTGEAHAEAGAGVVNGGLGAVVALGDLGALNGALMGSYGPGGIGARAVLAWQGHAYGLDLGVSAEWSTAGYADLVAATAPDTVAGGPVRDRLSFNIGAPLWFDPDSRFGAAFGFQHAADGRLSDLLTASYSRALPNGASLSLTGYHQFTSGTSAVALGLSVPLPADTVLGSTLVASGSGFAPAAEVGHPLGTEAGSVGWYARDIEGETPMRTAGVAYRSPYGVVAVGAGQNQDAVGATLELRGAIGMLAGHGFASDWIDDGFALVNAGMPGVSVLKENQPVGKTGADGLLVVTGLRSYQRNTLGIDPRDLPADAEAAEVLLAATPAYRSGVLVDLEVKRNDSAALVVFVAPDGTPIPAGAMGTTDTGAEFAVGYDGEAFVEDLGEANRVTISYLDRVCEAAFGFTPSPGSQVRLGPVTCQ